MQAENHPGRVASSNFTNYRDRLLGAPDGGAEAASRVIAEMGLLAEPALGLAHRLFQIATERGWASEALAYNQLAEEWPRLLDLAPQAVTRGPAATRQAEMFSA